VVYIQLNTGNSYILFFVCTFVLLGRYGVMDRRLFTRFWFVFLDFALASSLSRIFGFSPNGLMILKFTSTHVSDELRCSHFRSLGVANRYFTLSNRRGTYSVILSLLVVGKFGCLLGVVRGSSLLLLFIFISLEPITVADPLTSIKSKQRSYLFPFILLHLPRPSRSRFHIFP
jgi:hypothetical protein